MKKAKTTFTCQSCGAQHSKWTGKCDSCGGWNTLEEQAPQNIVSYSRLKTKGHTLKTVTLHQQAKSYDRYKTHWHEFDHVCGGGLVAGSVVLIGGDPGIGKSTLLLQVLDKLNSKNSNLPCLYISGEEGEDQILMRAHRLQIKNPNIQVCASTHLSDIIETLSQPTPPPIVVIDSIQTMHHTAIDSAPGTVSQVRACAHELISIAKKNNIILFIVGHVTKEGTMAGPKVLEHMVDTVLYFEGEKTRHFRILRAVKNRFGPADEIGVFEMSTQGLQDIANPSSLFLNLQDSQKREGTAIFAGIEGSRPILVEVQALVGPQIPSPPRRTVVGWDHARLSMILAVLEARCGLSFSQREVYLNIVGGLKISEPAADLAVAAALISSRVQKPLPEDSIFVGEIGLSGEVRYAFNMEARLKEAKKLGFSKAYLPENKTDKFKAQKDFSTQPIRHLQNLVQQFKCM